MKKKDFIIKIKTEFVMQIVEEMRVLELAHDCLRQMRFLLLICGFNFFLSKFALNSLEFGTDSFAFKC